MGIFTAIILGSVVIFNTIIAIFVLKNNPQSATNKIFFFLAATLTFWIVAMYVSAVPPFTLTIWSSRLTLFLATPMNVSFFLLAHTLPLTSFQLSKKKFFALILFSVVVMAITLSPFAFGTLEMKDGLPQPSPGPGLAVFGLFSLYINASAIYLLFNKFKKSKGLEHEQFRYVMYGVIAMFGLIIISIFLPVFIFNNSSYVPLAPLYTFIFLGLTAHAIIKHRLLDIRIVIARTVAYLLFIFLCAALYSIVLFVFVQKILNLQIDFFSASIALFLAIFSALSFQPFIGFFRHITSRIFYKDTYESNNLLEQLSKIMTETIDLQYMTTTILNLLVKEMHLSKSAFLIIEKKKITDVVSVNYKKNDFSRVKLEQLMTKDLQLRGNLFFEELPEGRLKNLFRKLDISLIIPIKVENTYVALLVLGSKLSGEVYNSQDIHLLTVFASESGIAIRHANAYTQIKKFNELLEKKVAERTKSLQHQNKKIKEQNTEISELLGEKTKLLGQQSDFLALAAHEFRTPLTVALLRTEDMLRKNKEKGLEDDLETMDEILKKLKELADKLYEILQYDFNKISLSPEKVNFYDFIEKIFESSEPLMEEKTLSFSIQNRLPRDFIVRLDPGHITQLLQNLIKNAVKLSPPKGKVSLTAKEDPKSVTLWVSDNGPGIPDKMKTQIFEKFSGTQGVPSLDVNLGLYVCKKIVELHRGKIWVEDNPNGGSIFIVSFPKQ